ncbi:MULTISPECIES: hypothetical protein [Streptomyces]|uniref:Uncharacterized protein n=1 Tax=Streptomyces gougerotii TaxID=53448 RepID=A0A8H9HTL4_9ACTN|nr:MULTISPECIES: hypothetical protein [Streptomyces]MDQ0295490.1 hypothetical protein [Streptomyces sp. DSM 41037]RPK92106.1 hypothetical protein EES47_03925 [Streptomyces sp. ADI98-12]WPR51170.1 hypothetical protein SJI45_09125 [Streptomyces sp. S399]GFH80189.1 hypothetical protein Sgou_48590 [Streptomyces gougerotii]GGU77466.1 hypothetical protein GCM10010227_34560 [Streptomyces gougerotii]
MRVGITGHRGLSPELSHKVRTLLAVELTSYGPADLLTAVSCLADGPDTWWAHLVLEAGGRLEAVVPAEEYQAGLPAEHQQTYAALLRQAARIHRTGLAESTSEAHQAGSRLMIDHCDRLVAVWDGLPARGYGGTADAVACAREREVQVRVVWPEGAVR